MCSMSTIYKIIFPYCIQFSNKDLFSLRSFLKNEFLWPNLVDTNWARILLPFAQPIAMRPPVEAFPLISVLGCLGYDVSVVNLGWVEAPNSQDLNQEVLP